MSPLEFAVEVVGWAGAALILAAYLLITMGKVTGQSALYQGSVEATVVGLDATDRTDECPVDLARGVRGADDLRSTLISIGNLENLRRKYAADGDKHGLRYVRESAIRAKNDALDAAKGAVDPLTAQAKIEIADWLTIWLQTPGMFDTWVAMRQKSMDFVNKFGRIRP